MLFSLAAEPGGGARPVLVLVDRIDAGIRAGLQDRARDESTGGNVDVVDDLQMAEDHGGAAERAVPADVGAAGDADAAGDRGMRADPRVVADLDLVVELHALLDQRVVHGAAVDGRVGADLDVVADAHRADLRDLHPAPGVVGEAEAIGADHGARMDDHAVTQRGARVDHRAGIEAAVVAEGDVVADHAAGADRDARAELRRFRHHGRRMHARGLARQRIEELRNARKVKIRRFSHDARARGFGLRLRPEHDGARARGGKLVQVALAGEEADVALARALEGGDLPYDGARVSGDSPAQASHDLAEGHFAGGLPASSALIPLSVMSMRGLAKTASWKTMSYFSCSAIWRITRFACSTTWASSSFLRWFRSSRNSRCFLWKSRLRSANSRSFVRRCVSLIVTLLRSRSSCMRFSWSARRASSWSRFWNSSSIFFCARCAGIASRRMRSVLTKPNLPVMTVVPPLSCARAGTARSAAPRARVRRWCMSC